MASAGFASLFLISTTPMVLSTTAVRNTKDGLEPTAVLRHLILGVDVRRQRKAESERRPVQSYITTQRTYVIRCPHCNRSRQYRVSDIPPDRPNPFAYDCPFCAAPSFVDLVGFRAGLRRRVHLPVSFTLAGETPRLLRLGTVLDISLTGLRLMTEPIKQLARAEGLNLAVVLDDQARSRLKIAGSIRRVTQSGPSMLVAVHFQSLKPEYRYILDRYLHHSASF
jgi:hypothetical protein